MVEQRKRVHVEPDDYSYVFNPYRDPTPLKPRNGSCRM